VIGNIVQKYCTKLEKIGNLGDGVRWGMVFRKFRWIQTLTLLIGFVIFVYFYVESDNGTKAEIFER